MSYFLRKAAAKPVVKQEPTFSVESGRIVIRIVVASLVEPQVTWSFASKRLTSGGRYAYRSVKQADGYCLMLEMDQVRFMTLCCDVTIFLKQWLFDTILNERFF